MVGPVHLHGHSHPSILCVLSFSLPFSTLTPLSHIPHIHKGFLCPSIAVRSVSMAPLHPEAAAREVPRELLGNGTRRPRRTHLGMHRARKHLERRRLSSGSGDALQSGPVASWLYFTVFAFMDLAMIIANTLVWSLASVFLFFFSRVSQWAWSTAAQPT